MHSNSREEIKKYSRVISQPVIGLKDVTTGDTLCARFGKIVLERMEFPEPVISVAVEPKSQPDQGKWCSPGKLGARRSIFRVKTDEETGQNDYFRNG